jgi:ABC-type polysaccharide/polyol phosphate transport system ATPase subunit
MKRIIAKNISKDFKIGFKKRQTTLERLTYLLSGKLSKKKLVALDNISFSINSGEIVGLIGTNGAGKTTLLSIIAGIFPEFNGNVEVNGRITTLIGLAMGFNPRLTLTENTFVAGSLLEMGQGEIKKKLPSIIKFAELEKFKDTKLYQFSVGMKVRLAVSIALHTDFDILLADEIFAMGDEKFKNKIEKRIMGMVRGGACVILASHRLDIIEKYSDRVIWLEKGKIKKKGNAKNIVKRYRG